jgi:heptosyltransferase-2
MVSLAQGRSLSRKRGNPLMKIIDPNRTTRILVRSANWVGDAIMTTPALHTLRCRFPQAAITLLAKPWVVPIFEHNTDIDDIMIYQAAERHAGSLGIWRLAGDIRKRRFDAAILFQNAFEAALLAFLAGIPNRIGFTTDGRSLLLTHRVHSWRVLKKGHLIDYYLGLIAGFGMSLEGRQLRLTITEAESEQIRRRLQGHGIDGLKPIIGFNPGATFGTAKRWPHPSYARLGKRLRENYDAEILVFGAPAEKALGEQICAEIGSGCLNLCGQTTLREAMAAIGECRLFITNDSGLMHVAAALDIPQIAIIGPTDQTATGPSNDTSIVLRDESACALMPCMKSHCPEDHNCMKAITVEHVFQTAGTMLDKMGGR